MPKPHTFPTLFDEVKTVSISFLTKHRYLKPNQWQSGTVTWSRNGNKTGSISIQVNIQSEQPYIELDYKCNEAPIKYRVQLVSAPSYLGRPIKIGNLEVAQFDFPTRMNLTAAKKECNDLGNGWRLPTLTESDLLCENIIICHFVQESYWCTS